MVKRLLRDIYNEYNDRYLSIIISNKIFKL